MTGISRRSDHRHRGTSWRPGDTVSSRLVWLLTRVSSSSSPPMSISRWRVRLPVERGAFRRVGEWTASSAWQRSRIGETLDPCGSGHQPELETREGGRNDQAHSGRLPNRPDGYRTVTPYITVKGAAQAIDFYKRAFGAQERQRMTGPDGKSVMHADIKIGDSMVMLCDEFPQMGNRSPQTLGGTTASIFLYVPDVDSAFKQAVDAGAKAVMAPADMFWGDRFGKLVDRRPLRSRVGPGQPQGGPEPRGDPEARGGHHGRLGQAWRLAGSRSGGCDDKRQ